MKIKKIIKYQNKLLKLKLIKSKIFNKNHYLNNIKIEDIEYRLKKIFHIIFKYHVFNKRILFIGTPVNFDNNLYKALKDTKHFLIPESLWLNGVINNKTNFFQQFLKTNKTNKKQFQRVFFYFKKDIDLIVLLNEQDNFNVLNESYLAKIPVISLNSNLNIQNIKSNYKIPGDFKFSNKKIRDNFFYSILLAVLKKGNKSKKIFHTRFSSFTKSLKKHKTFKGKKRRFKNNYSNKNVFYQKKKI
jgi:ribosomal protein S2